MNVDVMYFILVFKDFKCNDFIKICYFVVVENNMLIE